MMKTDADADAAPFSPVDPVVVPFTAWVVVSGSLPDTGEDAPVVGEDPPDVGEDAPVVGEDPPDVEEDAPVVDKGAVVDEGPSDAEEDTSDAVEDPSDTVDARLLVSVSVVVLIAFPKTQKCEKR